MVLFGEVRDPASADPVPGALVRAFSGARGQRVVADSTGAYALCVERADSVAISAVGPDQVLRDPSSLDLRTVRADRSIVTRQHLLLDPQAVTSAGLSVARSHSSATGVADGTVVRHDSGAPVSGATVLVRDAEARPMVSVVTNADGRFRFEHPDEATREFEITVRHVAYADVTGVVEFAAREHVELKVVLSERAIELDPIVVTQRRQGLLVDVGFYDRLEQGAGLFVERDEIERRRPSRITDLLHGRSRLRVVRSGSGRYDVRVVGGRISMRYEGGEYRPVDCQPAIWVDGSLVRDAGQPRTLKNTNRQHRGS